MEGNQLENESTSESQSKAEIRLKNSSVEVEAANRRTSIRELLEELIEAL